jgi:hypothetical protein
MAKPITYVGLDVHKDTIAVGHSGLAGRSARAREGPQYAGCLEGAGHEACFCGKRAAVLL